MLLALTFSGSVLTLVLFLLKRVFGKRLSSTVYYYAWLLVLLRFLLPVPGMIPMGGRQETVIPSQARMTVSAISTMPDTEETALPDYSAFWEDHLQELNTVVPERQETEKKPAFSINWKSEAFWLGIWATGAALSLGVYTVSYFRFSGILRRSMRKPEKEDLRVYNRFRFQKPALCRCDTAGTPMLIGVVRARILLPNHPYDEETLFNILSHELMHYRRRDTLYKWMAVLVYALQWFNPLIYLMRAEINRACELSCDEMLLRRMNFSDRCTYGETLLNMASDAAFPAGVVATTFATEKKNLKERLVQIMEFSLNKSKVLASVLAFVLLLSCAVFTGPRSYAENGGVSEAAPVKTVEVSTVGELIFAIAPDTEIILAPGTYDLSASPHYGEPFDNQYCYWSETYDGPELVIESVRNLTIRGASKEATVIAAVPRYASVLSFQGCSDITLADFTAGHTQKPGYCAGNVLSFANTQRVQIDGCGMYGCGVIGIDAWNCSDFTVNDSEIYSCSYGAVSTSGCRNFLFDGCTFRDHSSAQEAAIGYLFYFDSSERITVRNSVIRNNYAQNMLSIGYSRDVVFAGNRVENNSFLSAVFVSQHYSPVVEGCSFENNSIFTWVEGNGIFPVDAAGNQLGRPELESMNHRAVSPEESLLPPRAEPASAVKPSADGCYHVSNVDEFLAALGSERTIILDAEYYDLTTANDYGSPGNDYYFWKESYDGPELVITNVNDLTIDVNKDAYPASEAAMHHTITATPRYANVLSFQYCNNIALLNFTAGHTEAPGLCSGGVLSFQNSSSIFISSCRLYGCGTIGIEAMNSSSFLVNGCEIYDCSQGGAFFWNTDGISFDNCSIHDIEGYALMFSNCGDKTWNGQTIEGLDSSWNVASDGSLTPFDWDAFITSYHGDTGEQTQVYTAPEEVDPTVALVWARGELKRLQDLGILNRNISFDGELEYAAYADPYTENESGREVFHGFYARDYSGKYLINFRIDDTVSGDVRMASIEAAADPDEPHNDMEPIDFGNGLYYYYDNFDDIFPADLTVGQLCDKLAAYWGYSGWTLAGTKDEFYGLDTEAPSPDLLLTDLPEGNYYATVYFDGDQENVPMYFQIMHFPGRVCFMFGEGHAVG